MLGLTTIRDGQRAALWDKTGKVTFVQGPQRVSLYGRTMQLLQRHAAGAHEYLVIQFKDGRSQHLHGPAAVWFHPVEHERIAVAPATHLDAHEAIVVYRQEKDRVSRRIVRGPDVFMPTADEWLHQFSWHGSEQTKPNRKVPHALVFQKLRIIPDQMYTDVEDVRTADDALLVIQLMVFFELVDIERMLDQTHDVVADFYNDVSADVIHFVAGLTFEQFKEQTEKLNDLSIYRALVQRAERIGYRINKVVYRGYQANPKLQLMHDNAIEARTKLQLEAQTERQAQELADLRLAREGQRSQQRQEMEAAETAHQTRLKAAAFEEALRQKRMEQERELAARRALGEEALRHERVASEQQLESERTGNELKVAHQQAINRERAGYLASLQGMQVDLTRFLTARYQHPDRLIRIEGNGRARPRLHVHQKT